MIIVHELSCLHERLASDGVRHNRSDEQAVARHALEIRGGYISRGVEILLHCIDSQEKLALLSESALTTFAFSR